MWEKREREIIYFTATLVTIRMNPALRWAAMCLSLTIIKIVRDKVTRQCPQTITFLKREESRSGIEPKPFCLPA